METQKEDGTKLSSWIPLDVTIEILLRLPAKSVVRFRCVSKLWSSMTSTPNFIKSFAIHSSARPSILSCSVKKEEGKRVFFSFPHQQDPKNPYTSILDKFDMMLPKKDACPIFSDLGYVFDVHDSIRGLISFENPKSIIIWNPTLRQHVTLPKPRVSKPWTSLLGYDPIADEHKVLCMSLREDARKHGEDPKIITLGAQEKWRIAKTSPIHPSMKTWRCINGVLYYYGVDCSVVSFDVKSEKFLTIKKPEGCVCDMIDELPNPKHSLISYKGRLAWIYDGFSRFSRLWILEDAEKQEWSTSEFEVPLGRTPKNVNYGYLLLCGDTGDDELIYAPRSTEGEFCAFFYDLKRNITRKVTYEGIKDRWYKYVWFPNHIESLKSLY